MRLSRTNRPLQVLVVDDEPAILDISKEFLETFHEMRVTVAESGPKALDILAKSSLDAVVSDYQMPVMDGVLLLKELRSKGNDIPFILFTGRGREEVAMEALNNGADFYVQKGGEAVSQYTELAHKVRRAVDDRYNEKRLGVEKRRLEKMLDLYKMEDRPEAELFRYALQSALDLCEAHIGFLGRIIEKEERMTLICTIGAGTPMEDPSSPPKENVTKGSWKEAVRKRSAHFVNDAQANVDEDLGCQFIGSVRNMMIVPMLDEGEVKLVLGLGSNSCGFDDSDAQQITLLMSGTWEIVKRRRTEEHLGRLMDVENKFQTLFERSQDGIALMGETFREANTRWGEMLGYSRDELLGLRPWEVSPPKQPNGKDSRQGAEEMIAVAMRDIMAHFEWTHQTKDGRKVECDVILQKVTSKGEDLLLATIRDISREKRDSRIMEFMYRVSEAVQSDNDRRELFANIYDSLSRLLFIDSFYIAFRDGDDLTFPFYVDHGLWKEVQDRKCARGMTEHIMNAGRPTLLERGRMEALMAAGEIVQVGEPSLELMGVPLELQGRTVGMLAVQNYDAPCRFRQDDLDLLTFLSEQVSLALERISVLEERISTNSLLRGTVDSTPIGIMVMDDRNRILLANRQIQKMLMNEEADYRLMDGAANLEMLTRYAVGDSWKEVAKAHAENSQNVISILVSSTTGMQIELTRSPYLVDGRSRGSIFTAIDITNLRRIEQVLKESEDRLRAIFNVAPVGICVVKDRRFTKFNEKFLKLLGYTREELMRQSTRVLYDSDDEYKRVGEEVYSVAIGDQVAVSKTLWRRKDGSLVDLLLSVSPFVPGQQEKGYVVTLTDLSEIEEARRILQERLEFEMALVSVSRVFSDMESGKHYELLESALAVIGEYRGADRAYLFEMDPGTGKGRNTLEWAAEGESRFSEDLQELDPGMFPWWMGMLERQGFISIPDVSQLPPEAATERDLLEKQGVKSAAIIALTIDRQLFGFLGLDFSRRRSDLEERDFTMLRFVGDLFSAALSRWKKDEQIRREQAKLVNVLAGAPMGAMVFERSRDELTLTYFNEEAREMLGDYAEDLLGRLPQEVLPSLEEDALSSLDIQAAKMDGDEGWDYHDHRSGEQYQMWALPLDEEHVAAFFLNVTDIKYLDQRLLLANNKLTMVARLATHDMRNKAMTVNANLELLGMRLEDEGDRKYVERASKGVGEIVEIGDRLRNYLAIGSGSLGWVDLREAAEEAIRHMDQTESKLPAVEVDEEVGRYQVQADRLLPTLLYNMLSNSVKHGGGVTVIRLGAERKEGELRLTYEDDGKGVPEEIRGCLFDFTLDGSRRGHGLNFIKETLGMYGIGIELDSSYGRGARFILRVPDGHYREKPAA
ncbi:MAG: PAS domain S-box protein [Methanomassiliicoccales archaeon]